MENLFIETPSLYDFDKTVEMLSEAIVQGGWKISVTHDLQGTLLKNGIEVLPVKVIELCNAMLASQLLIANDTRKYSAMLPCRISVYEKEDGLTYTSIMNTVSLALQIGGVAEAVMMDAFWEADKFISIVTKKKSYNNLN